MTERRPAPSLHPLLARRWSPTAFDPLAEVSEDDVETLLEAARWSPSAGNSQPWAFVVGRRGDPTHARLVAHLAPSTRRWAPAAGVLVANLAHRYVEGTDWEYSEFALYDLGQAVAHMTVQALALGLHVRQFRAFDREGIAEEFAVPRHWEVTTMSAIGRAARTPAPPASPAGLPGSRERRGGLRWPTV
ncbi:MAG TPA: nitroreductase family protein [Kineosporiaceae bacterium]|jgi:nitroreductase|nr:nitroreductase family protein [Kineosporiaceae bacterium]